MHAIQRLVLIIGCSAAVSAAAQIVTFEFSGLAGNESSAGANFVAIGLGTAEIARGSGLTASANADRFNATQWSTGVQSTTKYFEVTLTALAGYTLDVTSIQLTHQRSSTGPLTFALRSSVDTYTTDLAAFTASDTVATQTHAFSSITLTGLSNVTFRIYGYSAEGSTGSWGIGDSSPASANDLIINGSMTAVPEPSTYATLAGFSALVVAAIARRKRQRQLRTAER